MSEEETKYQREGLSPGMGSGRGLLKFSEKPGCMPVQGVHEVLHFMGAREKNRTFKPGRLRPTGKKGKRMTMADIAYRKKAS